ncbi:MAG: endonuclease/exonuclease/phosphatase family protein [Proteiniphilum sp.]|nr:endonuclease/exonuclease/phosphatase family protein [Proteiniphilum sp.]
MSWSIIGCSGQKETDKQSGNSKIKILSYNVRNARGIDDVTDYDRVADVINRIDADCVAIQELDSATERSNGDVVLDELAKRTGMHASYNKSIDYKGGAYGVGVLTKEKPLRKEGIPLPGSEEQRSLLLVELQDYIICSTHWSLNQSDRVASVDVINSWLKDHTAKPLFLAGDLNAVPSSEEIQKLSKEWTILNDVTQPTIPVNNPNRCIDYLLFKNNPQFDVNLLESTVESEPMASDHLPVWVSITIKKNR